MSLSDKKVQQYLNTAADDYPAPAGNPRRRRKAALWACAALAAVGIPGAGFVAAQSASAATSLGHVTFSVLKTSSSVWEDSRSAAEFVCQQKYPATTDVDYMAGLEVPSPGGATWTVTYDCLA